MEARPDTTGRIGTLDILRLFSALAVLAFHYAWRGHMGAAPLLDGTPSLAAAWALPGYLGLNLFFMISGFVIAWSAEGRNVRQFVISRITRLYPGFVICMSLTFAVLLVANDPRFAVAPSQWLANLLMVPQVAGQPFMDGVYWTIVLEMIFYGWVALAIAAGLFTSRKLTLVTVWLALAMLNEQVIGSGALRFALITEYAPWFAFGVLVQHMTVHGRSAEALMLAFAALIIGITHLTNMQAWMMIHYNAALPKSGLVAGGLAISGLFLLAVALRHHVASTPAVLAAGGITYPLYLLHQNIGYVAINAARPVFGANAATLLVAAAMLLISYAVWRLGERPGQRRMRALLEALLDRSAVLITGVRGRTA
ncbi:MAG: acyltransferase [Notoacmeibacter sp.]|nr:acyltransferase [Notoacmeibacter sp.]MCC0032651.1 acyltransferase [Brucellaceae bacterium]